MAFHSVWIQGFMVISFLIILKTASNLFDPTSTADNMQLYIRSQFFRSSVFPTCMRFFWEKRTHFYCHSITPYPGYCIIHCALTTGLSCRCFETLQSLRPNPCTSPLFLFIYLTISIPFNPISPTLPPNLQKWLSLSHLFQVATLLNSWPSWVP